MYDSRLANYYAGVGQGGRRIEVHRMGEVPILGIQ